MQYLVSVWRDIAGCIPENSQELVAVIIQQFIGVHTDAISHIKGIGMNNSVSVAHTPSGCFVVRTNVASHLWRFQREAWCFEQLQETPVLTPKVLGCGVKDGHSYSVAPFIEESQPIDNRVDKLIVWNVLGRYASFLNAVPVPAYGSPESAYFPTS